MWSIRASAGLISILLVLPSQPFKASDQAAKVEEVNRGEKSIEGVVVLAAEIPRISVAGQTIPLSLELKNLGKEVVVFSDSVVTTFSIKMKTKEDTFVPPTLYLRWLDEVAQKKKRASIIELAPGKKASVVVNLDRLFDVSLFGEYSVAIEANYRVKQTPGRVVIDKLDFTIGPGSFPRIKGEGR
jgi:hypothetical protein